MRLSDLEIEAIRTSAAHTFGNAVSVWLFGSRVDDSKRGGDIDLLIVVESDQTRLDVLRKETDFLVALKQKIGEQKIDLIVATPESLASDPFLCTFTKRTPLTETHAIKITPELIKTSRLFLNALGIQNIVPALGDYLIYSDGRVVAFVEVAKPDGAGDATTTVITQNTVHENLYRSLALAELKSKLNLK